MKREDKLIFEARRAKRLYQMHRHRAKRSGIKFQFSLDEWINWWIKNLGPQWLKKRGRGKNKYCMARIGDRGPYANDNVKCITNRQNASERFPSKESRIKSSKSNMGHICLIETRRKIGKANSEYERTSKMRANMAAGQRGRIHSLESRKKRSRSLKKFYQRKNKK